GWKGQKAVGEIDPSYMYFETPLERMALHLDLRSIKLIFLLRNPIDRAFSHYLMTAWRGIETLSFDEGLLREEARIAQDYLSKMHFSYGGRGFYLPQIERFLRVTHKGNMMFILSDDLKRDTMNVLNRCYRFLGVKEDVVPKGLNLHHNVATV